MAVIRIGRGLDGKYAQVAGETLASCDIFQDKRLSLTAKGIIAWILQQPPDAPPTSERLEAQSPDDPADIAAALAELERVGYLDLS